MKLSKTIIIILSLFIIFIIPNVNAYTKLCLRDCEGTPENNPRYVCQLGSTNRCGDPGVCQVCVTDAGNPTNFNACGDQACNFLDDDNVDSEPPTLTVFSPINGSYYDSRSVELDLSVDSLSILEYMNLALGNPKWVKLCDGCTTFNRDISFEEGLNQVLIRATKKSNGQTDEERADFRVDSKEPIIKGTEPEEDEFVNGEFTVVYDEDNVYKIKLNYGNGILGYNGTNLTGCPSGKGVSCGIEVNLTTYDGQEVEYWFMLTDIAGGSDESKHVNVKVDDTFPVINSLNYNVSGKYVGFIVNITEANFEAIEYIDNSESKPRWKKLCSKLEEGICETKKSFKDGDHNLTIQVSDMVGHIVAQSISFFTDSKKPKIKKTTPGKGQNTNGEFMVEFDEMNPKLLVLNYGNDNVGLRNSEVNISNKCVLDKKYKCDANVSLSDYDGQEIKYWFYLEDVVGNSDDSRVISVKVNQTI